MANNMQIVIQVIPYKCRQLVDIWVEMLTTTSHINNKSLPPSFVSLPHPPGKQTFKLEYPNVKLNWIS